MIRALVVPVVLPGPSPHASREVVVLVAWVTQRLECADTRERGMERAAWLDRRAGVCDVREAA